MIQYTDRSIILSISIFAILILSSSSLFGNSSGRTGVTLKSVTTGCGTSGCHGGTSANSGVIVTISGPDSVSPNIPQIYKVVVSHTGGSCGVDIAVNKGTLTASSPLKVLNSEVTHSLALAQATSYEFTYNPPSSVGRDTIYATGKGTGTAWNNSPRKIIVITNNPHTDVTESTDDLPHTVSLYQNYPNPFNPTTSIRYALPHEARVTLKIYDFVGRERAILVDVQQEAGFHTVEFTGAGLSSGVYLYRLTAGANSLAKKLLLIK